MENELRNNSAEGGETSILADPNSETGRGYQSDGAGNVVQIGTSGPVHHGDNYYNNNITNQYYNVPASSLEPGASNVSEIFAYSILQTKIKRCRGCSNEFGKVYRKYPKTLIIRNNGWLEDYGKSGNSYFHLNLKCLQKVYPHFTLDNVKVIELPQSILDQIKVEETKLKSDREQFIKNGGLESHLAKKEWIDIRLTDWIKNI